MELIDAFDNFLKRTVNLDETRLKIAKSRVEAISAFLSSDPVFGSHIVSIRPQGSYRHETIIKPIDGAEYDVDLLLTLREFNGWEPRKYLENLEGIFLASGIYEEKVVESTRCVTIDYVGDFHVDIVPSIKIGEQAYVFNKKENTKEVTDAEGYAEWFAQRNSYTFGNLKKVVRLIKYLRDYRGTFDIKSILLTTLIAREVYEEDPVAFKDLPTTLYFLIRRLTQKFEQASSWNDIDLSNPVLPQETFERHLNQKDFSDFRKSLLDINGKIVAAYEAKSESESLQKWQTLFGNEFVIPKVVETALVPSAPHCQPLQHPYSPIGSLSIGATLTDKNRKKNFRGIRSGEKVHPNFGLKFEVKAIGVPSFQSILWQVVNTGAEATKEGNLRGGFFTGGLSHWEALRYVGVHWVQCFAIQNGNCVAKSPRFIVNIRPSI